PRPRRRRDDHVRAAVVPAVAHHGHARRANARDREPRHGGVVGPRRASEGAARLSLLRRAEALMDVKAYAKINLGLRVTAKREDGFHDIETIFQAISLCDTLSFTPANDLPLTS